MATRLLAESDVRALIDFPTAIDAVREAFRLDALGRSEMPSKIYLSFQDIDGDFRAMPARIDDLASLKWVNGHPHNPSRHGLPAVRALLLLHRASTAESLAIMDATALTAMRTGAAAAVATEACLGRAPKSLGIVGAGVQGRALIDAHRALWPTVPVRISDVDPARAEALASATGADAVDLATCAKADVVCTATPARKPILTAAQLADCAHINAMGADAQGKQELATDVVTSSWTIVDSIDQASHSGEINVPLHDNALTPDQLGGRLGDVILGHIKRPDGAGRSLFDSTGLAIQDLALASAIFEAAEAANRGQVFDFSG